MVTGEWCSRLQRSSPADWRCVVVVVCRHGVRYDCGCFFFLPFLRVVFWCVVPWFKVLRVPWLLFLSICGLPLAFRSNEQRGKTSNRGVADVQNVTHIFRRLPDMCMWRYLSVYTWNLCAVSEGLFAVDVSSIDTRSTVKRPSYDSKRMDTAPPSCWPIV